MSCAFLGLPISCPYSLFFSLFPEIRGHLSCAYTGQSRRKCCVDSLWWPQAGQLALSALLILCRYALSGMCPERSWNSQLAPFLEISNSLISFRNLSDGSDESICLNLCTRGEFCHSLVHAFVIFFLWSCFAADLLCFSGFLSSLGSAFASDVVPSDDVLSYHTEN